MSSLTEILASQRFGFHRSTVEVKETMQEAWSNNELTARLACLKAWYVRASWHVKLGFLLDIISMLGDQLCVKFMRYVGLNRFKDFNYLKSQDIPRPHRDVPLQDSNRCLNLAILEDIKQLDKAWIVTLKESQQLNLLNVLVNMGGCALKRKVYEVLRHRMDRSRKVTAILDLIPNTSLGAAAAAEVPGESAGEDSVGADVVLVVESPPTGQGQGQGQQGADKVKLELDWLECFQEIRDCYLSRMTTQDKDEDEDDDQEKGPRQSMFFKDPFVLFKDEQLEKLQKEISPPADPKDSGTRVDFEYIQFLPEPLNMMIFGYLDKDALKVARQVSPYWAFIADQVDKERAARAKVNAFLAKLSVSPGEKKAKPEKKGKKKAPQPPPPPPVEVEVAPPRLDPKGREKVVLLLKLFKAPLCKSFFSKKPVTRCLREEFFTFRVTCCDEFGSRLAVSTVRCSVDMYSLETGELLPEITVTTSHVDFITCMSFSAKGTHLVTGSADTTVRLVKVCKDPGECVVLVEHDKAVTAVCCGDKYVASGGEDGCVKVVNLGGGGECVFDNSSKVTALALDKDSVYAAFKSGTIRVFLVPAGLVLSEVSNAHVSVLCLASPVLVSGGGDGVLRAWDTTAPPSSCCCLVALGPSSEYSAAAVTAVCTEENYVVSGDCKGWVRVWNLVTGKVVKELHVCGLCQPVTGVHVHVHVTPQREHDVVQVFACTLSVLKVFSFERKQTHRHGLFGPAFRTCCSVYADPEEAKEKPFGLLAEEYLEKKLEKRRCVERKLKESLDPPMLSTSVLIAAIKKRPDVFMEPARNMVVYGRESCINT